MANRRKLMKIPVDLTGPIAPVPPPLLPVVAERGGTQINAPKATLIVDTREQIPFEFARFRGWFKEIKHRALKVGDYSVAGLEDFVTVERKDLPDLINSFTSCRAVFVKRLRMMSQFPHRLLVVTAPLSQIKSPYGGTSIDPNRITQSLIAALVGASVPFVCADTHALGAEIVASYLYQVHLYHWLEANDFGSYLADQDL